MKDPTEYGAAIPEKGKGGSMAEEELEWIEDSRKLRGDYRIFQVTESRRWAAGNREGDFFLVEAPDWITIVPLVKDEGGRDCFLMVRQYRHGSGEVTLEFPAGMVDPGEEPAETAARELREETGWSAGSIRKIGDINPNPAFMTNRSHTFLAEDCRLAGGQELDEHEMVETILIPREELREIMGHPPCHSAIMVQAYYWYLRDAGKIKK